MDSFRGNWKPNKRKEGVRSWKPDKDIKEKGANKDENLNTTLCVLLLFNTHLHNAKTLVVVWVH